MSLRKWATSLFDNRNRGNSSTRPKTSALRLVDTLTNSPYQHPQHFRAEMADEPAQPIAGSHNRDLVIASTSLGLSVLGSLFFAPLSILSWPGFFYISRYGVREIYKLYTEERKIGVSTIVTCVRISFFLTDYYTLANLSCFIYVVNQKLLSKIKDTSKTNLIDVFRQRPHSVFVLSGDPAEGIEIEIAFDALQAGATIVVNTGEMIAADGVITHGYATIDQQILTGEAQPVEKTIGDRVFASTVILSGMVHIKVEQTGEATTVAQIGEILNQTIDVRTSMQLQTERLTDKTVIPMLVGAALLLPFGVIPAIAFLYSHPLYKANIAGSVSVLSTLTIASRQSILIKDGRTLELLNQVDTVVFDKTGTLTKEQPHVAKIHTVADGDQKIAPSAVLRFAAAAEHKQTHPIARAILAEAASQQLDLPDVDAANYRMGYGISVVIDHQIICVGSARFMDLVQVTIPPELLELEAYCHEEGHSLIFVGQADRVIGAIELHATVRQEAKKVISQLRECGIKQLYILSGDHKGPTQKLARELGIEHYFAETLPEEKAKIIERLQNEGKKICYVGDGINDSIALKKATVSVSLSGASTAATDTAQIVLMNANLTHLPELFELSKRFNRNIANSMMTIFIPHAYALLGALFFNFGFIPVFILTQLSLYVSLFNSTSPLLKARFKQLPANLRDGTIGEDHDQNNIPCKTT